MNMIKQVIVIRKDLNMRKGKMVAQGCHCSMKVFFDKMSKIDDADVLDPYYSGDCYCDFTPEMIEWMQGSFTKIVVGCDSEKQLLYLEQQAKDANIPCALITDNGTTEFKETCPNCKGLGVIGTSIGSNHFRGTDYKCDICNGTGKVNKPTVTCLAIGPDQSEKIDKITGELELL